MLRKLFLLPLLFSPLVLADSVDVSATVTQPDANTYCVSGVCLSINGGSTTPAPDNSGPTIGFGPTQAPGEPGTVIVQKPPTCDVCEAGVLVFYMQPTCCPDGSVCDIAGLLSSGPLQFPTDCGAQGSAAITFDACTCTFYCNSTLGNGGAPTQPPTLPPTVAPTTVAPTTSAPTTVAPTTPAPTTVAPTTVAPTTQAPTTKAPTQAPTTKAPTTAPTTLVPTRANNPTQPAATTAPPSTCSRCNATHVFFVVFPVCCTNQLISTCNSNQIANAAKQLPNNCDENSITWDGCSCTFYCNATSATVPVNPNRPGNAQVLPVPQSEVQTEQVNINFNITKPNNNTRCIAGTSICITINSAPSNAMVTFPIIASVIMGLLAML